MKLTPLDVKKQEFKKSMRGYDPVEVDTFLEMVSNQLETLIREKNDLTDEVLKLKTQLRDYQDVEKTLKETLMTAQQSINESRENSNREAEMIIRDAEMKAEKLLENAKLRLAEMKNELVVIKAQKDSFARRLRHLLESQIELIQVLELDDMGYGHTERRTQKPSTPQKEEKESHSSHKPEQEKIEFEGVDEVLSHEQLTKNQTDATDDEQGKQVKRVDTTGREENPDDDEIKSRISDQLII